MCLRLKAACAVALMLLSLMVNANAYGNGKDRLWTRFSERMTSAALSKLPPSLAKKIVTGVAAASFICGSAIFSGEQLQPIKKSVDFTTSLPDRGRVAIALQGVDVAELQSGDLALDSVGILTLDSISIVDETLDNISILAYEETSAKMQNLILMQLQNLLEREGGILNRDVVWLELFEDNELQAFSYERARPVDLSRAAFYFITALTGAMLVGYPLYVLRSERDYPEYFPHPYVVALMVFGGVLLLSTGSAEFSINVGM